MPIAVATMPCFKNWQKLEVLSFQGTFVNRMPMLPQSLVCLNLSTGCARAFSFADLEGSDANFGEEGLQHPESCNLPNLEEFYVNECDCVGKDLFEFLTRASIAAGKLRIMDVGGREWLPDSYPRCDSLVGLGLARTMHWDEDEILKMVLKYPKVEELDLTNTVVTGYALKQMLTEGLPLKKVVLKDCICVSSDTFDYLESKGVVVVRR